VRPRRAAALIVRPLNASVRCHVLPPDHQPKFSWRTYAVLVVAILACVVATAVYRYRSAGRFDLASSILAASFLITYSAQGWWRMRKQIRDGSFSASAYNADPIGYMRGPMRRTIWFVAVFVAVTLIVVAIRVTR
jgi:hypothetical protein